MYFTHKRPLYTQRFIAHMDHPMGNKRENEQYPSKLQMTEKRGRFSGTENQAKIVIKNMAIKKD